MTCRCAIWERPKTRKVPWCAAERWDGMRLVMERRRPWCGTTYSWMRDGTIMLKTMYRKRITNGTRAGPVSSTPGGAVDVNENRCVICIKTRNHPRDD